MTGDIGGYEWGYTCPECEEFVGLSGMGFGEHPIVNGEKAVRTRALEPGDTVECPECGAERSMALIEEPDNLERALDLLRRQHYHDVADAIEEGLGHE